MNYHFGIEIEAVVRPKPGFNRSIADAYSCRQRLASLLRALQLPAEADPATGQHRRHPEHYDKWWITRDGSLQDVMGCYGIECVSPVIRASMRSESDLRWVTELRKFWNAMDAAFDVQRNISAGTHIHVSPYIGRWTFTGVKIIGYAVIYYEKHILECLPRERRNNRYCKANSQMSIGIQTTRRTMGSSRIASRIRSFGSMLALCEYLQGPDKYVLWNFGNVSRISGSGTIEFLGGRHLRGPARTLAWVTFVLVFIHMAMGEVLVARDNNLPITTEMFWSRIRERAGHLRRFLPETYQQMNETRSWT